MASARQFKKYSQLQKDVLALYRSFLRSIREKPLVCGFSSLQAKFLLIGERRKVVFNPQFTVAPGRKAQLPVSCSAWLREEHRRCIPPGNCAY
jgi:hypothetical protein